MNRWRISLLCASFGALVGLFSGTKTIQPITNKELISVSVMIENPKTHGGGSGAILESNENESLILTNAHICEVIKKGGVVVAPSGLKYPVQEYKKSEIHDLCLIKVLVDLKINLKVSDHAPERGDELAVVGHPSMLPVIVTRGSFSDVIQLSIRNGERECTPEDRLSQSNALRCFLFGTMPVFVTRDSQVISATIQSGSSGSPVFNKEGELQGVVFAGQGALSYGFAVPWEYLQDFIKKESKAMPWTPIL